MIQVLLNDICVYKGKLIPVNSTGTYLPDRADFMLFVLNFPIDSKEPEEVITKYLLENNIAPALPVKQCTVKWLNGELLQALYAPSFESYKTIGEYVITQDLSGCTWESSLIMNPTFYNVNSWLPVLEPLVQDLKRLLEAGIEPCGNSLNFLVTTPGSPYHVDSMVSYQVRYFGYNFDNDNVAAIQRLQPGELLKPVLAKPKYFADTVAEAVETVLNRVRPIFNEEDTPDQDISVFHRLCAEVSQKLLL
jgi:hypothetical protein